MKLFFLGIAVLGLSGCAGETPPAAAPSTMSGSAVLTEAPVGPMAAVMPDKAKAIAHLKEHAKYPATRSELLAACADTAEFTAAEKRWFANNIPEGTYASPEDVTRALGLKGPAER